MENIEVRAKGEIKSNKVPDHVSHHHTGHPWWILHQITSSKNKTTQKSELKKIIKNGSVSDSGDACTLKNAQMSHQ
jgi:hypothetical protein